MELLTLRKALVLQRQIYTLLTEVENISTQLAQALDRDDDVAAEMLVSMRQEPIDNLKRKRAALQELCADQPGDDGRRLAALLNGSPAQAADEQELAEQVSKNNRLLERVLRLDEAVNRKIAREESIYNKR